MNEDATTGVAFYAKYNKWRIFNDNLLRSKKDERVATCRLLQTLHTPG